MTSMRLGAGLVIVLATLVAAAPAQATFPGRNGAIAFVQTGSSGDHPPVLDMRGLYAAAWTANRGEQPRTVFECRLTDYLPSGGNCVGTAYDAPSYSPDGRRVVFDTGARLAVVDADGSDFTLLSETTADDGSPAFAPDGKRVIFTGANDHGTTNVYVRRLDGAARVVVYDASDPAWSSRNEIAYVRDGNIYRADAKGRHRRFVTSGLTPDWSPDGRRLAFVRPAPNLTFAVAIGRMCIVNANGRGLLRIGSNRYLGHPVWSPDGRWLAFDGSELGVHKRRTTRHAQPREIAPTQTGDEGAFVSSYSPAWQPR